MTTATKTIRRNSKNIKHLSILLQHGQICKTSKLKTAKTKQYDTRQTKFINVAVCADRTRQLHGDGDDGITAVTSTAVGCGNTTVMGLDFMTDTSVIVGMGTSFTAVPL